MASGVWQALFVRYALLLSAFGFTIIIFSVLQLNAFFTTRNLLNMARSFSWIALAACGESLVIIIGGIDLSVGAVMALTGLVSALSMQIGLPVPLAITAGLLSGTLVGWLNGTIVGNVKLPPFIVTLATMSIARGATHILSSGWSITGLPPAFRSWGQSDLNIGSLAIPLPFLLLLGLAALVYIIARYTLIGRYIYTLAKDEQALLVTGVNVARIKVITYSLCGFLAAFGGLLMTARLGVATPTAAVGYELDIIAAAVIGGISLFGGGGNILGVLVGAAFLQVLRSGLVL
ncbi:MAG: ABC transporter permease, partial [Anaerolineales bacterium]|nr:ABC transporter permease [Anaerolineales bacterium]